MSIEHITRKILSEGINLKSIMCEGKHKELSQLVTWQKKDLIWKGRKIQKTIDVCEFSEVENYILATRPLCKRRKIINEEAKELIGRLDNPQNSLWVETSNQQWLLSSIKALPLNQEKYLFNIETDYKMNYNSLQVFIG